MSSWVRSIAGIRTRLDDGAGVAKRPQPRRSKGRHHYATPARKSTQEPEERSQEQRRTWYDLDRVDSNRAINNSVEQGSSAEHRQFRQSSPLQAKQIHQPKALNDPNTATGLPPKQALPAIPASFNGGERVNYTKSQPIVDSQILEPPPSSHDLDRLNYHRALLDFGQDLQKAANAVFSEDRTSRYAKVEVLLLSWEEEDPNLPVSLEIRALGETFSQSYGYDVKEWLIPTENCHNALQGKMLEFLGDNDPRHLKIVYYGGHGKLTNNGMPAWTSRQNSAEERCPTVKWSGIQNTLEESRSDVLILLDCCASGVCTTDEGNGVTELMAACAYNAIANGVGPFSFTHALNTKLRAMAQMPYFSVGYLYNTVFTEVQSWRIEDSRFKKAPVHLVLTQNHKYPRSIRLPNFSRSHTSRNNRYNQTSVTTAPSLRPSSSGGSHSATENSIFSESASPPSSMSSTSQIQEYPRLLFSVRIQEDVNPDQLSSELFADWLRQIPVSTIQVRVEAGFKSDSTLLMVSMPIALHGYLPKDPAIQLLGTIRSRNCMQVQSRGDNTVVVATGSAEATNEIPKNKIIPLRPSSGSSISHARDSRRFSGSTFVGRKDEGSELSFRRIDSTDSAHFTDTIPSNKRRAKRISFSEIDTAKDDQTGKKARNSKTTMNMNPRELPPIVKSKIAPRKYRKAPVVPPVTHSEESKWTPPAKHQPKFADASPHDRRARSKSDDPLERAIKMILENPTRLKRPSQPPNESPKTAAPDSVLDEIPLDTTYDIAKRPLSLAESEDSFEPTAPKPLSASLKTPVDYWNEEQESRGD